MAEIPLPTGEVTRLLQAWRQGDREALESLIPLVYGDLHRMAERHLRRERQEETADALGISPATVRRKWLSAKAWLHRELAGPGR